jgi:hypothetical protein
MRSNDMLRLAASSSTLANTLSAAVLAWRGRHENASAAAPLNAVSHWLWGDEALQHDEVDARHTGAGLLIHAASSFLWGAAFAWLHSRRARPGPLAAVVDAAAVTATAAVVDLKLVPQRLTPGFERRLSTGGLVCVYAAFALGLALAARRR